MRQKPTVFTCTGYIGLSPIGSGILFPLFKADSANASFVQEIGQNGEITSFIPFYDHEHFRTYHSVLCVPRQIGADGLFAYIQNGELREVTSLRVREMVHRPEWLSEFKDLPLLTQLSLSRIGQADQSKQLQLLGKFLDGPIKSVAAQRAALAAHKRFNLNLGRYWLDVEGEGRSSTDFVSNEFNDFGTEELFEWLFQNEADARWTNALKTLIKRIVYDDRLFDLIGRLISMDDFDIETASRTEKIIVARGLEVYSLLKGSSGDFAESMYEYVLTGKIFALHDVIGTDVIFEFIKYLEEDQKLDFLPTDIFIDLLRSDIISRDLAYALIDTIESSNDLNTPYPDKSVFAGHTRLDVFKQVVANYGRLGLVVDATRRRQIARLVPTVK